MLISAIGYVILTYILYYGLCVIIITFSCYVHATTYRSTEDHFLYNEYSSIKKIKNGYIYIFHSLFQDINLS